MGLGYYFVNPDKKEYFNPALSGGYLRERNLFKEELHLYAIRLLMCEYPGDCDREIIDENLRTWSGDRLFIVCDANWPHEDHPEVIIKDKNLNHHPPEEYTDITEYICLYLVQHNREFAEQFIEQLSIESVLFMELVLLHYRLNDKSLEELFVARFGKDWEKQYQKSFKHSTSSIDEAERKKRMKMYKNP